MIAALAASLAVAAWAKAPFVDYRGEAPGRRHLIEVKDLPAPDQAEDVSNPPELVTRPADAWPKAPAGWRVSLYASGLDRPRLIRLAPNGDLLVAESYAGRLRAFRGVDAAGRAKQEAVFASGLDQPFGVAFYPPGPDPRYVYVGDTDAVVRLPYRPGELKAGGKAERVLALPAGGRLEGGGHWTRDVAFSLDGKTMFVSVGSRSNIADVDKDSRERRRAVILAADPEGKGERVYASGLRNAVGIAIEPGSGVLWATCNERDRLGDYLPPDYVTRIKDGGFYGWPWYYIGGHQDPRFPGRHPELRSKVIVPDVLIEPHDAPLGLAFGTGALFVASHGSWNRSVRTGYELIRVDVKDGAPEKGYEDFLTGFVLPDGRVWGRPVGVAVAGDGSIYVSDDASGSVWRVSRLP